VANFFDLDGAGIRLASSNGEPAARSGGLALGRARAGPVSEQRIGFGIELDQLGAVRILGPPPSVHVRRET
jgi:hypothetical protein